MNLPTASVWGTVPDPGTLSPLVGRDREIVRLRELLDDPAIRLVTITGPGGVGKTSLANVLAASLVDSFGDAITTVPLAAIRDPALVLPAIALELGLFSDPQDAPEDQLADLLGHQPALLVLDNLEQVQAASPALANLLGRCPRVTMLATSRSPLGIPGEQLFPLAPLPTPAASETETSDILRSDAVALFARRASAKRPDFAITDDNAPTIAATCRRLDGLPLAIELAAARTTILSPDALLARLTNRLSVLGGGRQDAPDRQRTMRDAIAWSYDLLAPEERSLLRWLAVFQGGFSLDAVEFIARELPTDRDVLDVLGALVDHSLVQLAPTSDQPRYLMLETVRDYGLEQLDTAGEGHAARLAAASHIAATLEQAEPHLTGRDRQIWLDRLDADADTIRSAAEWALASKQDELGLRIGAAAWRYCSARGMTSECRDWLAQALAREAAGTDLLRARAMIGAGYLAEYQRDLDTAQHWFQEATMLAGTIGDQVLLAAAHIGLGTVAQDRGQYAAAMEQHRLGLRHAQSISDQRTQAIAMGNMANVCYFQGKLDDARRYLEQVNAMFTALGDTQKQALCCCNLGAIMQEQGDFDQAATYLEDALVLHRAMKDEKDLPITLINLGQNALHRGDLARSREAYTEAQDMLKAVGNRQHEGIALHGLALLANEEGDLRAAASIAIASIALFVEVGDQLSIVESAELVAKLAAQCGMPVAVAELLAAATTQRAILAAERLPLNATEIRELEASARSSLAPREYNQARVAGERLSLDGLTLRIAIVAREIAGPRQPAITLAIDEAPAAPAPDLADTLTPRELDVLRLLVDGKSTQEIADALYIAPRTAGTHISNMLGKLGVTSRTAAVALALREGIV